MNPYYLLTAALLVSCLYSSAQDSLPDRIAPGLRYKQARFELNPAADKMTPALPLNSIEVLDVRQDTSKFGYFGSGKTVSPYRQFCFQHGASADIGGFLNNSFHLSPKGIHLLYCLKKCWISNADTTGNDQFMAFDYRIRVYIKAELFLRQGNTCYPLYRFDSIFEYPRSLSSFCVKWVEEALPASLDGLKGLDTTKVLKRNSISRAEIEGYYADEKRVAIAAAANPAKGVYLSFEQFKNNRPAYTDYEVDYDRLADIMRVKEADGSTSILKKDWGFCDGRNLFIRVGRNYYLLYKAGDTWDLSGCRIVARDKVQAVLWQRGKCPGCKPGSTITKSAPFEDPVPTLKPLQVDMETGKVY